MDERFIIAFFDTEKDCEEYVVASFGDVTEIYEGVDIFVETKKEPRADYFVHRPVVFDAIKLSNPVWLQSGGSCGWVAIKVSYL